MTESVISSERDKTLENTSCVPEKYIRGTLNINDRNINIRVGKNFRRSTANLFRRMVEEKMVERGKDPALVSKRLERKSKQLAGSFSKQVDEELQNVLNHLSIELWASHLVVEAVKKTLSSFIEDHADILDMDKLDPIVDPSLWVTTDREIRIKRITDGVSYDAKTAVEVAYSNTKVYPSGTFFPGGSGPRSVPDVVETRLYRAPSGEFFALNTQPGGKLTLTRWADHWVRIWLCSDFVGDNLHLCPELYRWVASQPIPGWLLRRLAKLVDADRYQQPVMLSNPDQNS